MYFFVWETGATLEKNSKQVLPPLHGSLWVVKFYLLILASWIKIGRELFAFNFPGKLLVLYFLCDDRNINFDFD